MAFKDTSSSEERARFFRGDCAHCGKAHTCTHTCARRVHTHTCTCRLQAPGLTPAARLRVRRRDCGAGVLLFLGVCHGNQGTDHLRRFFAPAAAWHPPEGSAGRLSSHPHAVRRHPALPGCPLPQGASLPPCTPPSLTLPTRRPWSQPRGRGGLDQPGETLTLASGVTVPWRHDSEQPRPPESGEREVVGTHLGHTPPF